MVHEFLFAKFQLAIHVTATTRPVKYKNTLQQSKNRFTVSERSHWDLTERYSGAMLTYSPTPNAKKCKQRAKEENHLNHNKAQDLMNLFPYTVQLNKVSGCSIASVCASLVTP